MTVVADTGALYALIDASDAWHARVLAWWRGARHAVVVPVTVMPEIAYLLQTRIGPHAELAFVQAVAAEEFTVESIDTDDVARATTVMQEYFDFPLGFVDASIIAVAERLGTREILTTDRRHFSGIKAKRRSFVLLP